MKIGENGIIVFKMYDLDMTAVNKLIFTFRGVEKIEKEYPSEYVNYADNRFYVGLTQEDTVILSRNRRVKVQAEAQICYTNGAVAKSEIISFVLGETLNTTIIPGNSPSDFVDDIEFHYENGIIIIGGSGLTEERVREIIAGYHFATESELENYVTLSALNAALSQYVTQNGLNDAIATYIDENVHLDDYATKTEVAEDLAAKQDVIQFFSMPSASADLVGKIYQFVGETSANFTKGLFYECVEVTPSTTPKTYTWVAKSSDVVVDNQLDATSSNAIANSAVTEALQMKVTQLSTLPAASADYLGQIVQYTGTSGNGLNRGSFYECVSDGGDPATYSWEIRSDLAGFVTPQMYGAKADGVTDDTEAIQQALNQGGLIYFAEGTYKAKGLRLSSDTYVLGEKGRSILAPMDIEVTHNDYLIKSQGTEQTRKAHIVIDGMTFRGSETFGAPQSGFALLDFFYTDYVEISNCSFQNNMRL